MKENWSLLSSSRALLKNKDHTQVGYSLPVNEYGILTTPNVLPLIFKIKL